MREMIVAETEEDRRARAGEAAAAAARGLRRPLPRDGGRPVTIRTLDPPLHEFLPHDEAGMPSWPRATGKTVEQIRGAHRGARTSRTRCSATAAAASASPTRRSPRCRRAPSSRRPCDVAARGIKVEPGDHDPARRHEEGARPPGGGRARGGRRGLRGERAARCSYLVGTMIEVPRGALTAGEIAETAEFFSFGTNDLTQTTFGLSRDDVRHGAARRTSSRTSTTVDPFVIDRPRGRRRAHEDRRRARPRDAARPQARHLRRARRRPALGRVLPRDRPRLRLLLAVPAPHRAARGGAGRAARRRRARRRRGKGGEGGRNGAQAAKARAARRRKAAKAARGRAGACA